MFSNCSKKLKILQKLPKIPEILRTFLGLVIRLRIFFEIAVEIATITFDFWFIHEISSYKNGGVCHMMAFGIPSDKNIFTSGVTLLFPSMVLCDYQSYS